MPANILAAPLRGEGAGDGAIFARRVPVVVVVLVAGLQRPRPAG